MNYFRSKTLMFGAALTVASVVQVFVPFLPPQHVGVAGAVIGAIVIILRFLTTEPVAEK